jgi:hypothetical protein
MNTVRAISYPAMKMKIATTTEMRFSILYSPRGNLAVLRFAHRTIASELHESFSID